jgi:hypothetical protein
MSMQSCAIVFLRIRARLGRRFVGLRILHGPSFPIRICHALLQKKSRERSIISDAAPFSPFPEIKHWRPALPPPWSFGTFK